MLLTPEMIFIETYVRSNRLFVFLTHLWVELHASIDLCGLHTAVTHQHFELFDIHPFVSLHRGESVS